MQNMSVLLAQRTSDLDKALATAEASCVELENAVKRVNELKMQLKEREGTAKVCDSSLPYVINATLRRNVCFPGYLITVLNL